MELVHQAVPVYSILPKLGGVVSAIAVQDYRRNQNRIKEKPSRATVVDGREFIPNLASLKSIYSNARLTKIWQNYCTCGHIYVTMLADVSHVEQKNLLFCFMVEYFNKSI